ncbi:DUF4238 domain-containing protein [uncultured Erythrobacter sp.]|uniref:DUF4238 domain-containing protein n=1 Tax=uncultured Erythrobacter sp. TaxID=263913 RepID=UPI00260D96E6|nr:DUF4238 domain-containing protein [uncultured Erythrobacter sp.]
MPQNKSHHYVPQMYMRLFARAGDNRIGVFAIEREKFIPNAPIRGQACRDYFYGKDGLAERAFGRIEGPAARIFARAIAERQLPTTGSQEHEWLIFYLGMQHSRTLGAAEQHNEISEKAAKSVLRTKAELEGNQEVIDALARVKIRRSNAVSELVQYATIGASLLADLEFVLIDNSCTTPFIASDTPVVLHNRLYEDQDISVTGYANVGLQLFLPLGPKLALFGFDRAAYQVETNARGTIQLFDDAQVALINDLQWEAAQAALFSSASTSEREFLASALKWAKLRKRERTFFREEIVAQSESEVRTRHGSGAAPSTIKLDLSFVRCILTRPRTLRAWEVPPFRDADRVARVDRAFARLDMLNELREQ